MIMTNHNTIKEHKLHRIGVISDTHGLLREEVKAILATCEVILHGGDIDREALLHELEQIAAVYAVRGNNDREWAENLPNSLDIELFGLRIYITHDKRQIPENTENFDLVVYGHSHKFDLDQRNGITMLNPGGCGPKRFHLPVTMAVVEVKDGEGIYNIEKFEL